MTANEIIAAGFALMGEKQSDFPDKKLAVSWLNMAVSRSLDRENLIREKGALPLLPCPQVIGDPEETVDMDSGITAGCLPYGVAAFLAAHRENDYLHSFYNDEFSRSLTAAAKGIEKAIEDFYKGGV